MLQNHFYLAEADFLDFQYTFSVTPLPVSPLFHSFWFLKSTYRYCPQNFPPSIINAMYQWTWKTRQWQTKNTIFHEEKHNDHVHSSQKLELPKLPKSFLIICSMGNIERKQVLMNPKWTSVVNSKQVSSITGLNVQNWNVLAWLTSQD